MPFSTEPAGILPGQRRNRRHAPCAFPVGVFLAAERCIGAIGPSVVLWAVVGGIHDDGVIGDAQLIDLVEDLADLLVVGDHPVAVVVLPALAAVLVGEVGPEVHGRRVVPEEEGLIRFDLLLHPADGACRDLLIDSFHALLGKGAGVFNGLLAYPAPAGVNRWIILVGREAMKNASGPKSALNFGSLG